MPERLGERRRAQSGECRSVIRCRAANAELRIAAHAHGRLAELDFEPVFARLHRLEHGGPRDERRPETMGIRFRIERQAFAVELDAPDAAAGATDPKMRFERPPHQIDFRTQAIERRRDDRVDSQHLRYVIRARG